MAYIETITNEQVAALQAVQFEGEIVVVDTPALLEEACNHLAAQSIIGFDTETRPSFTSGVTNKVALLQLYGGGKCFLIRLNRVQITKSLTDILSNRNILKIGAAVKNDIVGLNKLRHFTAGGFVDLQDKVESYGIKDKSLRKISGIVLGKKVSKAQRLSNWEAKVLTSQQQLYAATDAWVCVEIYNTLLGK
ncbi:MAG: 3'-5' exonuclease domain-containing protein 2 [Alistipes sp.]|nr:3'-5' exonuclease domain-containing protein 2 [Alistipes sp.]MBQ6583615.1 3'-5' exonuclease domain-containing protein 2 [Alistipes sp.]MBR2116839.1 3'-5' exonuclease domain-containing protein 2 [Alistipes sp.]